MTRTFLGRVKMACKSCRIRRTKCVPTSSSKCARCLVDERHCTYEGPTEGQREENRLMVAVRKRYRRAADSSSEESESSSYLEDEEDEDHIGTSPPDRPSMRHPSSTTLEERRVGIPSGTGSNPTFGQLVAEFQKGLDEGKTMKAQVSSIPPRQPGFAERIVRALSPETTPPPPKRRKQSMRPSWETCPTGTSASSDRQSCISANSSDSGAHSDQNPVPDISQYPVRNHLLASYRNRSLSTSSRYKLTKVGTPVSEEPPRTSSCGLSPANSQACSIAPPPSSSFEDSTQMKQQNTMLRVHLAGESKHKVLSLRKCSWAPSLLSEIVKTWAITERDVKKLCFTFTWMSHDDSARTLELEDEFGIIGVNYLFELVKDAPCWSGNGGILTGMCLIDVDIFAFRA